MKSKRILAAALSCALALASLTACSNSDSSKADNSTALSAADSGSEGGKASAVLEEPDFMGNYVGDGDTEYIGMSVADFNKLTNDKFIKDNALEYTEGDSENSYYAAFSLGKKDSILGGRVSLGGEYDVRLALTFDKDRLARIKLTIEKIEKEEGKKIADNFIKAFDGKLPEGYEQFPVSERGKTTEVGFSATTKDNVFSVTTDENLDGDHIVYFDMENYSYRYDMGW